MEAKCVVCRRLVSAQYDFSNGAVHLVRLCDTCGVSETLISGDPDYFARALAIAETSPEVSPAGVIVELLDQCDIQCPTCIASSGPSRRNLRDPQRISAQISTLSHETESFGVFLSGGEPAVHPQLFDFIKAVDSTNADRKVLITNGLRLARESGFAAQLIDHLGNGWEVFLQFDVLDADILRDIRGDDFVRDRELAVGRLGRAGISTTLVAVAKRGVSLERVHETVRFGLDRSWVRGVQIQPIREAGRLENFDASNTCLASDVHRVLVEELPGIQFDPYVGSPLSVSLAYFDRESSDGWIRAAQPSGIYIEPTTAPSSRFRVSVMEYSDDHNWSSLRLRHSPLAVLQADGSAKRVDDHWEPVPIALGTPRVRKSPVTEP